MTVTFPSELPADTVWIKVKDNAYSIITPTLVAGNTLTLTLVDSDGDGVISDPGGPGVLGGPVGGYVEPVNKLSIITPYVASFGVIATVAVVVAAPRKKHN